MKQRIWVIVVVVVCFIVLTILLTAMGWGIPDRAFIIQAEPGYIQSFKVALFSPDGRMIVTADWGLRGSLLRVWDGQNGKLFKQFILDSRATSAAFSPDGQFLTTGHSTGAIYVWDIATSSKKALVERNGYGSINYIAYSSDGQSIVAHQENHATTLWDALRGERIAEIETEKEAWIVVLSPDGQFIAVAPNTFSLYQNDLPSYWCIWRIATGIEERCIAVPDGVFALAWSVDGHHIVTGGRTGVLVWDIQSGQKIAELAYGSAAYTVGFSPDGRFILIGSDTNLVTIWNAQSREKLAEFGNCGAVSCKFVKVVYNPDGQSVLVFKADPTKTVVEIWTLPKSLRSNRV